ncbi:hypothetical protein Q75_00830 [Bacillus coahuilensis p1.1.43]|uniref:DUF3221 domain-containing protein n=1 Tax=Bacillus coahuilensis p1.1.43 TaxID=1150625 RepID=A0A147KCB9_9BACI|nr:hypothetical protein [Bacillus coahuilensis]KUP09207.1 hypothetical protein Q75_00830 [Bacillus coahuilensis p1.1.43]
MKKTSWKLILLAMITFGFMVACENTQEIEADKNSSEQSVEYDVIRDVAEQYLLKAGWNTSGDWNSATITIDIVEDTAIVKDTKYLGEEVYHVSLDDPSITASPVVLVDPETKEGIGFIPGE